MADRLTDQDTRHWTRREHPLTSLIRIDGKTYRLMGAKPERIPPLPQVGLQVLPTRTIYEFEGDHVHVTLTFMTPALPDDLSVLARPVTYLTWDVSSTGPEEHSIAIFAGASSRIAADPPGQAVAWSSEMMGPLVGPSSRNGQPARAQAAPGMIRASTGAISTWPLPGRVLSGRRLERAARRVGLPRRRCPS